MRGDGHGAQRRVVGQMETDGWRQVELALSLIEQELDVVDLGVWEVGGRDERGLQLGSAVAIEQALHAGQSGAERAATCGQEVKEILGRGAASVRRRSVAGSLARRFSRRRASMWASFSTVVP